MIPFHDENPTKHFPLLTIALIAGNIFVFFWEFSYPGQTARLFTNYGLVPYEFARAPVQTYLNVFSAMFLHADSFTWRAICSISGFSEITLRMSWARSGSLPSICCVG